MLDAPETLVAKLNALAANVWWSWHPEVRALFRELDPELWLEVYQNPVAMLQRLEPQRVATRVRQLEMQARIHLAHRKLEEYLGSGDHWAAGRAGGLAPRPVAYFCAEFGLHHSLPIYSGGLGVLAGDHMKATSDLGVNAVGLGLLYHEGYVHQEIDAEGRQRDRFEPIAQESLPTRPLVGADGEPLEVEVPLPGRRVSARVWTVPVGRNRLLLLDARHDANSGADADLTAVLYGGDEETRIQQEMLLGVGGWRALRAAGIEPSVLHLNEGHSAFALLAAAAELVERMGLSPEAAFAEVAAKSVFTTHTPVAAGHDYFPAELVARHLEPLAGSLGVPVAELVALGQDRPGARFCTTVLALRMARRANGVSALHGRVSRRMWAHLWPERSEHEVPIGHITNGIHVPSFLAADMERLLARHLGGDWARRAADPELWRGIEAISDAELWEVHQVLKSRLLDFVRETLARRRERLGLPAHGAGASGLDPMALTLGFARRFATYKRADLLLADPDRLERLINHPERPVQLVFAGKAHPKDEGGKELVRRIASLEGDPRFAGRIVFLENYSLHVARQMVQGVDAWLNNPRRPLEACGTSGQKCILNGVLNVSVLDGWWAEAYDGANGFAIGAGEIHGDPEAQDSADHERLLTVLEEELVPLYYRRNGEGIPTGWVHRIKRAMRGLAWRYSADRMVQDYVEECYLPAAGLESCRMG